MHTHARTLERTRKIGNRTKQSMESGMMCLACGDNMEPVEGMDGKLRYTSPYWGSCCGVGFCRLCSVDLETSSLGRHDLKCDNCQNTVVYQVVDVPTSLPNAMPGADRGGTQIEAVLEASFTLFRTSEWAESLENPDEEEVEGSDQAVLAHLKEDLPTWTSTWADLESKVLERCELIELQLQAYPPRDDQYGLADCLQYLAYRQRIPAIQRHLPGLPDQVQMFLLYSVNPDRETYSNKLLDQIDWTLGRSRTSYMGINQQLPIMLVLPNQEPVVGPKRIITDTWGIEEHFSTEGVNILDSDVTIVPHARTGQRIIYSNAERLVVDAWVPKGVTLKLQSSPNPRFHMQLVDGRLPSEIRYQIYQYDPIDLGSLSLDPAQPWLHRMPSASPVSLNSKDLVKLLGLMAMMIPFTMFTQPDHTE